MSTKILLYGFGLSLLALGSGCAKTDATVPSTAQDQSAAQAQAAAAAQKGMAADQALQQQQEADAARRGAQ